MQKGPHGQLRLANPVGCAVQVMKIATGQLDETFEKSVPARAAGGRKGGKTRAQRLSSDKLSDIGKKGAEKRWK